MKNCQTWYGKDGLLGKCTFEDVFFPFPKVGHGFVPWRVAHLGVGFPKRWCKCLLFVEGAGQDS